MRGYLVHEGETLIEPLPSNEPVPTDLEQSQGIYLEGNEIPSLGPSTVGDAFAAFAAARADVDAKAVALESALALKKETRDRVLAIFDSYDAVSLGGKALIFDDSGDGFREARVANAETPL